MATTRNIDTLAGLDGGASPPEVEALMERLHGGTAPAEGVVHVVAVWESSLDYQVLAIGPSSPKSPHDFFCLQLSRAMADAIVVTGKILRDEPELSYSLEAIGGAPDLRRFRASLGKEEPPLLVVLTSGQGLDLRHPALHGWPTPVIATGPEGAGRLGSVDVEVFVDPSPGLQSTLAWLRQERGLGTVTLEAGPSTVRPLYEGDGGPIDEIFLSVYRGPTPPEVAQGPGLVAPERLQASFEPLAPPRRVLEASGPWEFSRWRPRR